MSKLFSVIILYYNQKDYWKAAVDSVLMQDYPDIQIVFADDGSKDTDFEAIVSYVRDNAGDNVREFIFQRNARNGKTSKNCNSGLKHCTGDYIVILDGDDAFYDREVLTNFAKSFDSLHPDELIVTSRMKMYDERLDKLVEDRDVPEEYEGDYLLPEDGFRYNQMSATEQYHMLYGNFVYGTASTAFRKELFALCGRYDEEHYTFCQDGYLFLHVLRQGHKFHFFDFVAVKHRAGGIANPLAGRPATNQLALQQDYVTLMEREILPELDSFSPERQETILRHYFYYSQRLRKFYPEHHEYTLAQIRELAPKAYRRFVKIKKKDGHDKLKVHTCLFYSRAVLALLPLGICYMLLTTSGFPNNTATSLFFGVMGFALGAFSLVAAGRFLYMHLRAANPLDVFSWLKANIVHSPLWSASLLSGVSGMGFLILCTYLRLQLPVWCFEYGLPLFLGLFAAGICLLLLRLVLLLWDHSRSVIIRK